MCHSVLGTVGAAQVTQRWHFPLRALSCSHCSEDASREDTAISSPAPCSAWNKPLEAHK